MNNGLKQLIMQGRQTKVYEIYGHSWEMKVLDAKTHIEATSSISVDLQLALKISILSRAIIKVDGDEVDSVVSMSQSLQLLPVAIIDGLYKRYEMFLENQHSYLEKMKHEIKQIIDEDKQIINFKQYKEGIYK